MTLQGNYPAAVIEQALDLVRESERESFLNALVQAKAAYSERRITDPEELARTITLRQLAYSLDKPYNTVMRWAERRPSTHFPEPTGRVLSTGRGRYAHGFDLAEVHDWVLTKKGIDIYE